MPKLAYRIRKVVDNDGEEYELISVDPEKSEGIASFVNARAQFVLAEESESLEDDEADAWAEWARTHETNPMGVTTTITDGYKDMRSFLVALASPRNVLYGASVGGYV